MRVPLTTEFLLALGKSGGLHAICTHTSKLLAVAADHRHLPVPVIASFSPRLPLCIWRGGPVGRRVRGRLTAMREPEGVGMTDKVAIGPDSRAGLSECMVRRRVASEKRRMAIGLRQCIRPLVESLTPGHDGYPLALVRIMWTVW
jgi:hypothetical protein